MYASPIDRTRQTAEHIAAHHELPVRTLDGVIEADYGEWTGGQLADLAKTDLWKVVQRTPSRARFPNGESIAEMQTRTVAALEAVVADHPGEIIVVVSHADPIKSVIAHFTGVHLDLFQRIAVSPASVTVFVLGPHGVTLVKCNDTGSLAELVPAPTADAAQDDDGSRRGIRGARAGFTVSMIELDGVDALGAGAIGEPGARAFYIQADKRGSRLTVLVEKEQVALLAQEAVAFLDRIADDHPEPPAESALLHPSVAQVTEPAVPLFRARMIGLGFEPDRGLVLIELRERAEDDDGDDERRGRRRRLRRPDLRDARAGAGDGRARLRGGPGRPAGVLRSASSRWTRPDTSARGGTDPRGASATLLARGTIEVVGSGRVVVERGAARDRRGRRRARCSRSTSRSAASGRSGTSPTARCAGARPRRTSSARRSAGTSSRPPCCATVRTASGMVQRFVEHDPDDHYFTLLESHPDEFRRFAAFDVVVNNADRKGGHCLQELATGHVFGIDHGLTFHIGPKLRTVIWDFASEPVPEDLVADLEGVRGVLDGALGDELCGLLHPAELDAMRRRVDQLLATGATPSPTRGTTPSPGR